MGITINFNTENAAFADSGAGAEVARILRKIADQVENGADGGVCIDINGNKVGGWNLDLPEEE